LRAFKFLNRETQQETGWIDLMARQYDAQLGVFRMVDPVIEGQEHLSLYQYGWNNPILRSDPNGDCPECPDSPQASLWLASTLLGTAKELAVSGVNTLAMMSGNPLRVRSGEKLLDFELDASRLSAQSPMQLVKNLGRDILDAANVGATMSTGGAAGAGIFLAKTGGKAAISSAIAKAGKEALEEQITLRHYTSNQGLEGIQKDMTIKAYDQNKVFAEKAKGKPLSAADAADKYLINKKDARNYVEFQTPASQVQKVKNPLTGNTEYVINGNVTLDKETTKFYKRN
jgi:RHS repeat-associated protein